MYEVGRKPKKSHVFAQQISRVFSVCQDTLLFGFIGRVLPQGLIIKGLVGDFGKDSMMFVRRSSVISNRSLIFQFYTPNRKDFCNLPI